MQPTQVTDFSLPQFASAIILLIVVALPVVALIVALSHSRLTAVQCFLWAVAFLLCKFLWRTRWLNELPLPTGRGGIIVCNHRSSVDPFFVQTATGRKI